MQSSSVAKVVDDDDLLTQILLALPAKSLLTLRLVRRQWHIIISSDDFIDLHLRRRPRPNETLFLLRSTNFQFYICNPFITRLAPFRFEFPHVTVLQSCNGLLLLSCRIRERSQTDYYVFNPTTMQYRSLNLNYVCLGLCLVFDPMKSPHYRVFGFRKSNRYTRVLSVYSSETHTWNYEAASGLEIGRFREGIYWKGVLYHIQPDCTYRRFSIEDEKTYQLPKPPKIMNSRAKKKYFNVESNGHMHSISLCLQRNNNWLDIHELSHGDYCWSRIYHVDLNEVSDSFAADDGTAINVLGMVREERVEDSVLLFHVPDRIMVYTFRTNTFEGLFDHFSNERCHGGTHQFIESLAPV